MSQAKIAAIGLQTKPMPFCSDQLKTAGELSERAGHPKQGDPSTWVRNRYEDAVALDHEGASMAMIGQEPLCQGAKTQRYLAKHRDKANGKIGRISPQEKDR